MKNKNNIQSVLYLYGFITLLAFTLIACTQKQSSPMTSGSTIKIENAWVRAMPPVAKNSAAYMKISNHSNHEDRLISITSSISERAETHNIIGMGDMVSMRQVKSITIPAKGSTELKPGGLHIMLLKLNKVLTNGDSVQMVLHFEKVGQISISIPVKENAGMNSSNHNMNHSSPHKMVNDPMKKNHGDNGNRPMKGMDHNM